MNTNEIGNKHIPVLLNELINSIEIKDNKKNIIVDCTLGIGGHASKIIEKLNHGDTFVGFDADQKNLKLAKKRLEALNKNKNKKINIIFINSNFINLKDELLKYNIKTITGIYYDLGLSSLHLDEAERGFSFMLNGPLDMRLDKTKGKTAAYIVNSYKKEKLREIFLKYGEEPSANKLAQKIIEQRKIKKFKTTKDLSEIIQSRPKIKAKIFQAIRIEVNNELKNIEKSLIDAINLLERDGIIFAISFHSLEDRIVKQTLKKETKDCICKDLICSCKHYKKIKLLNKKPIIPTNDEIKINSRSRSAKARIAKKII